MDLAHNYLHNFVESAHVASVIPLGSESTFYAMLAFGGYPMLVPCLLSICGAALGQIFNWAIGRLLLRLRAGGKFNVSDYWYDRLARLFNSYGFFLLFFCWAPLCNVLVVIAGFLGTRLRAALPLVALGEAVHYGLAVW